MVEFREKEFVVHVPTAMSNPVEEWLELQQELLEIMTLMDEQVLMKPWRTLRFLIDCLPDYDTASRMAEK